MLHCFSNQFSILCAIDAILLLSPPARGKSNILHQTLYKWQAANRKALFIELEGSEQTEREIAFKLFDQIRSKHPEWIEDRPRSIRPKIRSNFVD